MKTDKYKTVFFGNYYQSSADKKDPIEWLVLDEKDGKQLLLSRYALDCKPYNEEWEEITWEICTLRRWLNKEFINEAFSKEEQARIEITTVTADENPEYDIAMGNDTEDKVFILSINEAVVYFASDSERACEATVYAFAQGAYHEPSPNINRWWWLRSTGLYYTYATYVSDGGEVNNSGIKANYSFFTVRPALWVKL